VRLSRWVVTRSLADSNFHGHRPAIQSAPRPFWGLHEPTLGPGRQLGRFIPHRQYCLPDNGPQDAGEVHQKFSSVVKRIQERRQGSITLLNHKHKGPLAPHGEEQSWGRSGLPPAALVSTSTSTMSHDFWRFWWPVLCKLGLVGRGSI